MQIACNRLDRLFAMHQTEYEKKAVEVLRSGYYIMGKETAAFEREFAAFLGGGFVIGVGCGLDAIRIALHVLGVGAGDEVVIQGNTFIAAVLAILQNGATPVFAEPDDGFSLFAGSIKKVLTEKTKAVIVTHLYGMMTPMAPIVALCRERGLLLLEDAAQAHGAADGGKKAGTFGDAGCFSFYPTKNLGGFGDGGAIFVRDPVLAQTMQTYKNYGSDHKYHYAMAGINSRLDEMQAGLLRVRLRHLDEINADKAAAADHYTANLQNPYVVKPVPAKGTDCVWHQYVIRCETRDELAAHLREKGISTDIHYPVPPHLSDACRFLGVKKGDLPLTERLAETVLSLPLYVGISREEQDEVIRAINGYRPVQ
ncbi:MAG: DegT/DnrJ/EryC1/StrS family aminotransferase [Clostridia bacterium]|nr:DegT/DnrJ/EryC1/StrS family aminotransferase [Clostridia bacterium]